MILLQHFLAYYISSSIPFGDVHPLLTTMGDNSEWLKLPIDQKCEHKVNSTPDVSLSLCYPISHDYLALLFPIRKSVIY